MSMLNPAAQYATPTVGQTVTITAAAEDIVLICEPAGALATLTITLPTASRDRQRCTVSAAQAVTALTLNSAAGSVVGALTTVALGGFATYLWLAAQSKWYRCG